MQGSTVRYETTSGQVYGGLLVEVRPIDHHIHLTSCCFISTGVGDGGRGNVPPKIRGKIFLGQLLCKIRAVFG